VRWLRAGAARWRVRRGVEVRRQRLVVTQGGERRRRGQWQIATGVREDVFWGGVRSGSWR